MTVTLETLQSEPTKPNLDRLIEYMRHPIWARRFITGLVPSNGTDASNDLDFTVGVAADLSGDHLMELKSAMTKQIDGAWAEGTNAGMLDTGAVADTVYHVYLIKNRKSGKVDILASTSASSPTMPTGYTLKRRIFSFRRIGGVNTVISAKEINGGGLLVQVTPQIDSGLIKDWTGTDGAAQTGTSAVIPSGVQMEGKWTFIFADASFGANSVLLVSSFDVVDTAPVSDGTNPFTANLCSIWLTGADTNPHSLMTVLTRASDGAIRYRATGTTADHSLGNTLYGWTDFRVD